MSRFDEIYAEEQREARQRVRDAARPMNNAPTGTLQQVTFAKYVDILNRITRLGFHGFARVLDTANPDELAELAEAADVLQEQLARLRA